MIELPVESIHTPSPVTRPVTAPFDEAHAHVPEPEILAANKSDSP